MAGGASKSGPNSLQDCDWSAGVTSHPIVGQPANRSQALLERDGELGTNRGLRTDDLIGPGYNRFSFLGIESYKPDANRCCLSPGRRINAETIPADSSVSRFELPDHCHLLSGVTNGSMYWGSTDTCA